MAHFFLIYLLDALGLMQSAICANGTVLVTSVQMPNGGIFPIQTSPNWSNALIIASELTRTTSIASRIFPIQPLYIGSTSNATLNMKYYTFYGNSYAVTVDAVNIRGMSIIISNKEIQCRNNQDGTVTGTLVVFSW